MSERDIAHGIRLGRTQAIAAAHRGLTALLQDGKHITGPDFHPYVKAEDVSTMLGEIR